MQANYTKTSGIKRLKEVTITARLTKDVRSQLKELADERGLKVGTIAREALIQYLERQLA